MTNQNDDDAAIRDLVQGAHENDPEHLTIDLAESLADIRRRAALKANERIDTPASAAGEAEAEEPTQERRASHRRVGAVSPGIAIGIVTTLPVEYAAVRALVNDLVDVGIPEDTNIYGSGWLPSREPARPHRVVVALTDTSDTSNSATAWANMIRSFPGLRTIVMCGITGGLSTPNQPERHVRLGDVVVATEGIVSYDDVRAGDVERLRQPVEGLSTELLRADHNLTLGEIHGERSWHTPLADVAAQAPQLRRPPDHTDPMYLRDRAVGRLDRERALGWPRVHHGAIGSTNLLLRQETLRNKLATTYNVRAVEMEGAGFAIANLHDRSWFVVRGVADYGEADSKTDQWQGYAALTAAAYVRALLAEVLPDTRRMSAAAPYARSMESYTGVAKARMVRALLDDWAELADYLGIAPHERAQFNGGDEARGLWEWLESRGRLTELPAALAAIGRTDLAFGLRGDEGGASDPNR